MTLGVSDVGRERDFYSRLGRPLVLDSEDFVVFEAAWPLQKTNGTNILVERLYTG
jgi:hypothetical protein